MTGLEDFCTFTNEKGCDKYYVDLWFNLQVNIDIENFAILVCFNQFIFSLNNNR